MKKAAMFGLDARIALAIFGALSVISGAALYSAIKSAKVEQLRQFLEEMVKASEQYYLDNGKPLPQLSSSANVLIASDLVSNRESLSTWNGPYIDGDIYSTQHLKNSIINNYDSSIYTVYSLQKSSTWSANDYWQSCILINSDCSEYVTLHSNNSSSAVIALGRLFSDLDEFVDNGDGAMTGKVRYVYTSATVSYLIYMGLPRKRTI